MPLLDYASDDDSDAEAGTLSAVEGPGIRKESDSHTAVVPIVDGFHLPAPKSNRRRDGPVKIKVDLPKLNDTDDEPPRGPQKKSKISGGPIPKGAGTSSLLSMLPAPKKEGVSLPKRARVLGGGLKGSDIPGTTIFVETNHELPVAHPSSTTVESSSTAPSGLFVPPSMARSRLQESKPSLPDSFLGPVSALPPKPDPPQSMNFFSLGTASTKLDAAPKPTASIPPSASGSAAVSSAPVVKEYIPPKPTPMDPYPGYYQRLSGEWAAYDPEYYKTFWEQWQGDVYGDNDSTGGKGKRKNREWEGKEDQMVSADASEEAKKGQIAEREAKKNLTGSAPALAVVHGDAKPRMNIQAKSHGRARQRGQLSSLLVEAYENRAAIEEKLAEARRNKKEAGNKYGF